MAPLVRIEEPRGPYGVRVGGARRSGAGGGGGGGRSMAARVAEGEEAPPGGRDVTELVRAAGGILSRLGADGMPVVGVIHRPRYNDWSFPKGKLHPGEDEIDAAIREVEEETGMRCDIGPEI